MGSAHGPDGPPRHRDRRTVGEAVRVGKLDDALDYAAVVKRIRAYAEAHEHPLLERFAEGIATLVRGEFGAPWVRVRVAKLGALPGVKEIGVEIVR